MNDKAFDKLLHRLTAARKKYSDLLDSAELEYKRRYGRVPSELNDDFWIDSFQLNKAQGATFEEVDLHAKACL